MSFLVLGSARVSRVGLGISPKQPLQKSPRWRDVIANTRDACATRTERRESPDDNWESSTGASASQNPASQKIAWQRRPKFA